MLIYADLFSSADMTGPDAGQWGQPGIGTDLGHCFGLSF